MNPARPAASAGGHEDAEGVAVRVGVDPQRLFRVVGAVLDQYGAQRDRPLVRCVELCPAFDGEIEVQLLRDRVAGSGRPGQLVDLLERQSRRAVGMVQVEPIPAGRVVRSRRRLVTRPVDQAEQLPPELRAAPGIRGVDHYLPQLRHRITYH